MSSYYKDDYAKAVQVILAEHLGIDESDVMPDKDIYQDLGADSLDNVELIMTFEEEYNIDIDDEDAEKCRTVADVVAYLERRLGPSNDQVDLTGGASGSNLEKDVPAG